MRTSTSKSTKKAAPVSLAKLSRKAKAPVKAAAPAAPGKKLSVLKTLCAEVGINPKVARRVLRAARRAKEGMQWHSLHTRWVLSGAQRTEAKALLSDYVARNGKSK